ncbi:MAG: glutathione S-transferase family protein [bacterium]|nr:glutathione S-transferase family protein [bacterium]
MGEEATTLYGTPLSLYTGKARSYLIKNGLPYREVTPATSHYSQHVAKRAQRVTMPTIETAEGVVVRDGAAIVEYFESQAGHPATPSGPRQRIVSGLLDAIGMEGLLRPAMHYRWNFPEENHDFLLFHFASLAPPDKDSGEFAEQAMGRMRQAAMAFGVVPDTIKGIEARYLALMEVLDQHFADFPYLLGGRPCTGDFSLIAPLYGHLGRDPKPLSLMQSKAVHLFRWVERMNRPEPDCGEFVKEGEVQFGDAFAPNDEIPETLVAVLRQIAIDFVPETIAAADFINTWLDAQSDLPSGTPLERGMGLATFEVQGASINALAQPYRFYLLSRAQADFASLSPTEQSGVEQVLDRCNLLPILDTRLTRTIGREDNLEVWD